MRRRDFITLVGGAAVWPLAALAQQAPQVRRIGFLTSQAADDPVSQAYMAGLLQGLQELGWTVGRNVRIDYRWGAANIELKRRYAAELVALAPDVIVATGDSNAGPLLQATRTVPIVFVLVPDPVSSGFVASLARPGGNATGFTNFEFGMSGKWPELLKQIGPSITHPTGPGAIGQLGAIRLPALIADLVRRRVVVIATPGGEPAAIAAKAATATIPIVFGVGDDPVKLGLVASLARSRRGVRARLMVAVLEEESTMGVIQCQSAEEALRVLEKWAGA
jgi:ABC-type uncharacterized transport system substrate-binding protein